MNKFKKITLGLLGAALLTTGLYSCSNDNETVDVQQTENKTMHARTATSVLKQYYGSDLRVLSSVKIVDDLGSYILTKYAYPVNDFTDVYTLTDTKGEIEFLIELDKRVERIKSTNVFTSEVDFSSNLGNIKGLKDANFDLVSFGIRFPIGSGLRFWGWSCTPNEYITNELTNEDVGCFRTCVYMIMGQVDVSPTTYPCDGGPETPRIVGPDKMPK